MEIHKKICDKCKKDIPEYSDRLQVKVSKVTKSHHVVFDKTYDYCEKCFLTVKECLHD